MAENTNKPERAVEGRPRRGRIGYIDIAKGLAMLLIIVGHVGLVYAGDLVAGGVPGFVTRFAFTVHLPVFFIASGYFLRMDARLSRAFVAKEARSLIVPYVAACALIVVTTPIAWRLLYDLSLRESVWEWFCAALWGAGAVHEHALVDVQRIGGVWFLLALFWARLLVASLSRLGDLARLAAVTLALVVSVVVGRYIWLPLSVISGFGCAFYVYVGMLIRKYDLFERVRGVARLVPAAFWAISIAFGGQASLAMSVYPLGVLDVLGGVGGCFCLMWLSMLIERRGGPLRAPLERIGRNTLSIFSIHIIEDNALPWGLIGSTLSGAMAGLPMTWVVVTAMRVALDLSLASILRFVPLLGPVFFPRRGRRGFSGTIEAGKGSGEAAPDGAADRR